MFLFLYVWYINECETSSVSIYVCVYVYVYMWAYLYLCDNVCTYCVTIFVSMSTSLCAVWCLSLYPCVIVKYLAEYQLVCKFYCYDLGMPRVHTLGVHVLEAWAYVLLKGGRALTRWGRVRGDEVVGGTVLVGINVGLTELDLWEQIVRKQGYT